MLKGLQSKKLIIGLAAAIGVIVNDAMGQPVSQEAIFTAVGLLATYILGQGIADHGQQGKAKAAERAAKQGGAVASAVQGALGAGERVIHDDDDDDGAEWIEAVEERTGADDEDGEK